MDEQDNNRGESPPFLFYEEPQRAQCLNFLLHLAPYSNDLLLVYGEKGSGKTTLIKQFSSKASALWDVCILEIQPELSASAVAERLFSELKINSEDYGTASALSLSSYFKTLQNRGRRPILVFDDAHLLTKDTLHFLDQLISSTATAEYGVSIIMFGEDSLSESMELTALKRHGLHSFELPSLEVEEVTLYLHHRLKQARIPRNRLSAADIKQITKKSKGNMSLINKYSDAYLHGSVEAVIVPEPTRVTTKKRFNIKFSALTAVKWVAGLGMALLLVLALVFQEKINRLVTTSPSNEDQSSTLAKEEKITAFRPLLDPRIEETKPDEESIPPSDIIHRVEIEEEPSHALGGIETALPLASPKTEPKVNPTPEIILPLHDSVIVDIKPSKPIESVTPSPAPLKVEKETVSPSPPPVVKPEGVQNNAWLMARNAKHYTLQLMAMRKKSSVLGQLKNVDNKSRYAIFATQRKGRSMYILLYGDFTSSKEASLAQQELPAQLSKNKPWIRTFSGMQKELQKLEK